MKKAISILFLVLGFWSIADAQSSIKDSLMHELTIAEQDSDRIIVMTEISRYYRARNADSCMIYSKQALTLAQNIKFSRGEVLALRQLGFSTWLTGDIPEALKLMFKGLQIAEENFLQYESAWCLNEIGTFYGRGLNDNISAMTYYHKALLVLKPLIPDDEILLLKNIILLNTGISFLQINQYDSAMVYLQKAKNNFSFKTTWHPVAIMFIGKLQFLTGNRQIAMENLQKTIQLFVLNNQIRGISEAYNIYAGFFKEMNQPDSAIYYAKKGLEEAHSISYKQGMLAASNLIAEEYESTNIIEAYKYIKMAQTINEELYGAKKVQSLQKLITEEQERQRKIEAENLAYKNRLRMNSFLGITFTLIIIAIFLFIINRRKQKAKQKIESAFNQLKATQSQLIQSEKMASLGELTAGIAHEIQNPLNFVNNFSEVNQDLISELREEIANKNFEEADQIAKDVEVNEQKINHHGKRADAIVKGMLQHSRTSTGPKELTDINALADEYLRLAYHGMKAKDKLFNADFKLKADESLPKIKVIPQDIGRVLLNLINNAFYVVNEKSKQNIERYKPEVIVKTSLIPPSGGGGASISVSDNGPGIPASIIDKIFQPFFTTKPTGQGTGLGLSLSYDIVKAHGGELKVETKEDQGTEFIIQIPIT
ncbi:MAG TPA: ATP-binding protein [Draconibacterium sp.]|nr:ATP-binding protein [Draconibacterium sp.]